MRRRFLLTAVAAAASIGVPSAALAQRDHRHDPGPRHGPPRGPHARPDAGRHPPGHGRGRGHGPHERHFNARGPRFRRGRPLPVEYRTRHYVVHNWRAHRLAPPRRGHQWVQVGPDFVLVAAATGLIVNVVLSP